jgi:energy-coupling factor transporter transmembrane protein EcfT
MTSSEKSQRLRRTISPYMGQIIILALVTLGVLFVAIKSNEWKLILSVPVMWLLFLVLVYIGLKYKIYWTDAEVCQEASGGQKVCIKYGEITKIASEISKPAELLSASRPFRRIAIYAEKPNGESKFIDVSLKHFSVDDVRKLMQAIHDRCPDLTLPKH